jgi:hypothetical protein
MRTTKVAEFALSFERRRSTLTLEALTIDVPQIRANTPLQLTQPHLQLSQLPKQLTQFPFQIEQIVDAMHAHTPIRERRVRAQESLVTQL